STVQPNSAYFGDQGQELGPGWTIWPHREHGVAVLGDGLLDGVETREQVHFQLCDVEHVVPNDHDGRPGGALCGEVLRELLVSRQEHRDVLSTPLEDALVMSVFQAEIAGVPRLVPFSREAGGER